MRKVYCLVAAGIIAAAGAFAIVSDGADAQDGSPTATTGTATTASPTTGTPGAGGTASPAAATSTSPAGSPTGGAAGTATRSAPVAAPDTGTGTAGGEGNEMLWMIALLPVVAFGAFYAASRVRSQ